MDKSKPALFFAFVDLLTNKPYLVVGEGNQSIGQMVRLKRYFKVQSKDRK